MAAAVDLVGAGIVGSLAVSAAGNSAHGRRTEHRCAAWEARKALVYLMLGRECLAKNRSISRVASGPFGSVYEPSRLPPDHA